MNFDTQLLEAEFHLWEMGLMRDGEWEEREAMLKFWMAPDQPNSAIWNPADWDGSDSFRKRAQELWEEVHGNQPTSEQ